MILKFSYLSFRLVSNFEIKFSRDVLGENKETFTCTEIKGDITNAKEGRFKVIVVTIIAKYVHTIESNVM